MLKIVGVKSHSSNENRGFVIPLYIIEDNDLIPIEDAASEFPNNGKVFITSGYSFVDTFSKTRPFLLEVSISNKPYDGDFDSKYVARGIDAEVPLLKLARIYKKDRILYNKDWLITILSNEKPVGPIFIQQENKVLGPFKVKECEEGDDGYFDIILGPLSEIGESKIFQFSYVDLKEHLIELEGSEYIWDIEKLLISTVKKEDIWYESKKEILSWAKQQFGKNIDVSILEFLNYFENIPETNFKIKKLKEISQEALDWLPVRDKIIFDFFDNTEGGKILVAKFLEENKSKILKEENVIDTPTDIQEPNIWHQKTKNLTAEHISFLEGMMGNTDELDKLMKIPNLYGEEVRVNTLIGMHEKTLEKLNNNVNKKNTELNQFQIAYDNLRSELRDESTIKKNLLNIKTYTDILNGIDLTNTINELTNSKSEIKLPSVHEKKPILKDYVQSIVERLDKRGRKLLFNDVFNYLILIQQNFLTVFAGLPGSGKTSLVRELSLASGLDNLFCPISVARGWTSLKDLIGYWNPLTQRFQAANNNLYKDLQSYSNESFKNYPYWILLDEANLSPIEHYWSDFMMLGDLEDSKRELSIRDSPIETPTKITLGSGLRFVGTINFDHTTETLSPRLKDRAAIVMIDAPEIDDIDFGETNVSVANPILNYSQANELFNTTNIKLTNDEARKLNSIISVLKDDSPDRGMPILVSPRKIKAISKYCSVARDIMEEIEGDTQFTALDYAICQFVLPLVEGRTESFKRRLETLTKELTLLPRSSTRLKRIIEFGKVNNHNYRFFC